MLILPRCIILLVLCPVSLFSLSKIQWVDSVYQSLSLEHKIGQLYMLAGHTGTNMPLMETLIKDYGIGGITFMQGSGVTQANFYNHFQEISKVPLWISMDAEWGLGMRIDHVYNLPKALTIGAANDSLLAYEVGACIAQQCKRLGIHINFGPVVDLNSNPNNPVINYRSFGENKYRVTSMALAYMKGLQQNGVIACAKHFPGHGDTESDSHTELPMIKKSKLAIDSVELYPFKQLFQAGLQSVMMGHLRIPSLDSSSQLAATLSSKIVDSLLIHSLNYQGLIITDALNMSSVSKFLTPAQLDLQSLLAGNDVLLFSKNVPAGVEAIKEALKKNKLTETRLAFSVKKILGMKYDLGLNKKNTIDTTNLINDLQACTINLRTKIAEKAITCIKDENQILSSVKNTTHKKIIYVGIGRKEDGIFVKHLNKEGVVLSRRMYPLKDSIQTWSIIPLQEELQQADVIVVGVHQMNQAPNKNFGLEPNEINCIRELSHLKNALIVFFGNPYALTFFPGVRSGLIGYNEDEETQLACAKIISGHLHPKGILPVSVNDEYKVGMKMIINE